MLNIAASPTAKFFVGLFIISFISSIVGIISGNYNLEHASILAAVSIYFMADTSSFKLPVLIKVVFLLSVISDILFAVDYEAYEIPIMTLYLISYAILNIYLIAEFKRIRIKKIDIISLVIIYGFIFWLIYMYSGIIQDNVSDSSWLFYVYMGNLVILLLGSFTHYTSKSYWASMWLVVVAASAVISESAFFLTEYLIETNALQIIYIIFHLVYFIALLKYAENRRISDKFPFLEI